MTINRSELKQAAKDSLRGKWGIAMGVLVIYYFILIVAEFLPVSKDIQRLLGLVFSLLAPALQIGLILTFLQISRNQNTSISTLFIGASIWFKALCLKFVIAFFTILWSLLFIIPGIIASLSYSMALYIMADNKSIGIMDAIKESKRITQGYKEDIFVLGLSFIGWGLLCCLTLGIGFLWLAPYIATTFANLYNKLSDTPEIVDDGDYIPAT